MENAASAVSKLFTSNGPVASGTEKGSETTNDGTHTHTETTTNNNPANVSEASTTTTSDEQVEVAPAVSHTHVKREHETRAQKVVEKEKHQDHYHTTIQPLSDTEVLPEKHSHIHETEHRNIDKEDGAAEAQAMVDQSRFEDSLDEERVESETVEEPMQEGKEHVHHHLHETVVPVVEKEVIDPSITHKRIDVKEKIQERAAYHGTTTNSTLSREEFEAKIAAGKT